MWYRLEKDDKSINKFRDCVSDFHDYRLEKVEYISRKDMVDVFLRYDSMKEGILLRFAGIQGMNIFTARDYGADWIYGSWIRRIGGHILWIENDDYDDEDNFQFDEIKSETTWILADWMFWAVTDGDGNPVPKQDDWCNPVQNFSGNGHRQYSFHPFPEESFKLYEKSLY